MLNLRWLDPPSTADLLRAGDRIIVTKNNVVGGGSPYLAGWRGVVEAEEEGVMMRRVVIFDHAPGVEVEVWTSDMRRLNLIEKIGEIET